MDPDARVAFTEIKGDVKLILAGQDRTNSDLKEVKNSMTGLDKRVGALEADKHLRTGERQGLAIGARVVHWITGGSLVAIAAIIARSLGL